MTLKDTYKKEIAAKLLKDLGCNNMMEVPKLEKVVLNMGIGTYIRSGNKDYSVLQEHLALISGQAPVVKMAKKAISNFGGLIADKKKFLIVFSRYCNGKSRGYQFGYCFACVWIR